MQKERGEVGQTLSQQKGRSVGRLATTTKQQESTQSQEIGQSKEMRFLSDFALIP